MTLSDIYALIRATLQAHDTGLMFDNLVALVAVSGRIDEERAAFAVTDMILGGGLTYAADGHHLRVARPHR